MKITMLISGAVLVVGIMFAVGNYVTYKNYGVSAEAGLDATYEDNKNVLSNYTTKVMEAASVTEMARDDLSKVIKDALSARYGEGGAKSVVSWIKENYPGQLDPKLYQKIQQIIESGRNDFKTAQTSLIDKKRVYQQNLNYVWSGFWLGVAGYPKTDLNRYNIIVTDDVSKKFETGTDSVINLRPVGSK